MLEKYKVKRGCIVPIPLAWPSTNKSDGTEVFEMTVSVDNCNILLETRFVSARLLVDTTWVLSVGSFLPLWQLPERGQNWTSNRLHGLHS